MTVKVFHAELGTAIATGDRVYGDEDGIDDLYQNKR